MEASLLDVMLGCHHHHHHHHNRPPHHEHAHTHTRMYTYLYIYTYNIFISQLICKHICSFASMQSIYVHSEFFLLPACYSPIRLAAWPSSLRRHSFVPLFPGPLAIEPPGIRVQSRVGQRTKELSVTEMIDVS